MKIGKKILAANLALMSAFAVSAAEPVEIEKPTDSPIITKNEKSTGKRIVKGIAIGVAGTLVLAAGVGTGLFVEDIFETHKMDENGTFKNISRNIFEWYLNMEARECVVRHKNTKLGKVLIDLFDVLDGKKSISKWCIIRNFKCVCHYMGIFEHALGCEELRHALIESDRKVEYFNIKHLEPSNISVTYLPLSMFSGPNMYSICVDNIADFSKNKEEIMQINSLKDDHVYNLKEILMFDEESCCFNTVYLKQEDGKWHGRSFDGIKKEPLNDDLIINMLGKQSKNVNLIYMKTC